MSAVQRIESVLIGDAQSLRDHRTAISILADDPATGHRVVQHPDWIDFELLMRGAQARPAIVLVLRDGEPLGYAPILRQVGTTSVELGPLRIPVRAGPYHRLLGADVVARPEHRGIVRGEVARVLREEAGCRVLHVQETPLPSALADAVCAAGGFRAIQSNPSPQLIWSIAAPGSVDAYLKGFSSKRRKSLQSRSRGVRRDLGGEVDIACFDSAGGVDAYCRQLATVYARSWHAAAAPIDWEAAPLRAVLARLAGDGRLLGYILSVGGRPLAYVHGYHTGGIYEVDNIGYDQDYARHGVGSMLVFEAMLDFFARHPGSGVDFGYGHNVYKRVLANRSEQAGSLFLARGRSAWLLAAGFGTWRRLRSLALRLKGKVTEGDEPATRAGE